MAYAVHQKGGGERPILGVPMKPMMTSWYAQLIDQAADKIGERIGAMMAKEEPKGSELAVPSKKARVHRTKRQ